MILLIKIKKNLRIIYIASAKSIHSARWIKFFSSSNNIIWITNAEPSKETIKEFNYLKKKTTILNAKKLKDLFKILKLLLFEKYSLIHIHYLGWHSLLTLLTRPSSNLILTPWGSDLLVNNSLFKKIWLIFLFKKAKYTICDSERLKNTAIKLGAKKNKILISMFGIDTNSYKAQRSVFSDEKKIVIGSNRKFEKIYDVLTLLKTAKSICENRDDILFLIAGDGSLKLELKKYVLREKLSNKIIFLGLLNKEEMHDFYNKIDIFVSTSLSDGGLSSSIAEAMSFERVVIATNNSDNSLWIKDHKNGYLFENKDSVKLRKIIELVLKNKNKNVLVGKSARKVIELNYSYKKEMMKVNEIYKRFK